mgnify:CR=1 FL=1
MDVRSVVLLIHFRIIVLSNYVCGWRNHIILKYISILLLTDHRHVDGNGALIIDLL